MNFKQVKLSYLCPHDKIFVRLGNEAKYTLCVVMEDTLPVLPFNVYRIEYDDGKIMDVDLGKADWHFQNTFREYPDLYRVDP